MLEGEAEEEKITKEGDLELELPSIEIVKNIRKYRCRITLMMIP